MKFYLILLVTIIYCSIIGCNPIYYRPNTQQVPLFKEKGEIRASVVSNLNDQFEIQTAYAVNNNIGILANGIFVNYDLENDGNYVKGNFIEVGGGYYKPIWNKFVFECYGTVGYGNVFSQFGEPSMSMFTRTIETDLLRIGVLPLIGYRTKYFSAAFSSRLAHLSFFNYSGGYVYESNLQTDYLRLNKSNMLIEPALTLRGGWNYIQLQAQIVGSYNLSNKNFYQDTSSFSIGLLILLQAFNKSTK